MENEKENALIKLTEELVSSKDDQLSLVDDYARLKEKYYNLSSKLDGLVDIILANCELDYTGETLTISDRKDNILAFVRFIDPETYHDRREALSRDKDRQEELSRLKAEESKEVKKNGK